MGQRGVVARVGAVVVCALGVAACGQAEETLYVGEAARVEVAVRDAAALPDVVSAADALGLRLIAHAEDGNVITSPAGAQVALAMVGEGAAGVAAEELDLLLGASGQSRSDAVNALMADLERFEGDPGLAAKSKLPDETLVHLANHVVVNDQAEIFPEYLDRLSGAYGVGITGADLGSSDGIKVLDAWVRKESGGLIEKSAIAPTPLLRLVLQNMLVLAARWDQPFEPSVTRDAPFTLSGGETVSVAMMHQMGHYCYVEQDGWAAVRLPYSDGDLVADLVLPPPGLAPADLTPAELAVLVEALDCGGEKTEIELGLPRVDVSTSLDLIPLLDEATPGIRVEGGLPGISSTEPLLVEQAVQQGVLRIDEDGTVAAVATEVGIEAGAAPPDEPIVLVFDRPFLARIAVGSTGWPLIMARVNDPSAG